MLVSVDVGEAVKVGVAVGVCVTVKVGVLVIVGVFDGVSVAVEVKVLVWVGVGVRKIPPRLLSEAR